MLAAKYGKADNVKLLLEAGASTEAKTTVSKRLSICTCVCVRMCVLYSCIIVSFYSLRKIHYCDM